MPVIHRKMLGSGLVMRRYNAYPNDNPTATPATGYPAANDTASTLTGVTIDNRTTLTTVGGTSPGNFRTQVVAGYFRPNVTGTWQFRIRSDDAGYLFLGTNAMPLEDDLVLANALCSAPGPHSATNGDGTTGTLTAGVLYPFKAFVGNREGGYTFIINFQQSGARGTTATNGTGFFFHNPYAPNGLNLNAET